nr:MAG TPA: hypothetical protein [Caudoviricetes sp.]
MFKKGREQKQFLENYKKEILQEDRMLLIKILMKVHYIDNNLQVLMLLEILKTMKAGILISNKLKSNCVLIE